ncbi:MAG: T9SS type A sorting domain-containing protein, partial [Prevotellaceae bacterium]|nr:T9SS type A sorting domain-containing protein [Prevotellaceae bacterium]
YPAIQAATGCESAVGNPVTVTVNALPTAPSIDNVTACYDGYEHKVDEPDIEGETIVWYKDATGSETVAPSRTDIGTTTVYAAAKITATGCESATRSKVTVEVKRIALVGDITVTGEQTICSGSTTTLTVNSAVENPVYKWYSSQDTDTPFHTGNEYITPELTETATYYISVSGDGVCENIAGDRKYVKVTVNQAPELTSPLKPETILSNSDFNYTAKSSIEGTEFSWKRLDVNGISQTASAGAMDLIAEMLTNLTLQPVEVDYLITLTSPEGCTATQTVTATVYPVLDPPKITSQPPAAITYSVCEQDAKNIEIKAETVAGTTLSYQWYSNTVESFDGVAVSGATDSLFTIPADLPAGNYYYYCEITSMSDFCATVTYSDIIAVTVEPENADFVSIAVNGDLISLQNSVSEYMAECGEFALLDIVSSSKYARITVNGVDYSENHEVQLIKDETEVVVRILACDGATVHEHTLTILKALPSKLLYMRWDDVIAVNRNETNNGNFHKDDILGVRWYKRENPINTTKWFIELDSPETDYRAEINLKGKWHRICGAPVKREAPAKQIIAYPNPILTGETLTVELFAGLEEATMNIYTITGSTVKRNVPLPSKYSTTDIDLNQGIYILEIVAQNKKHGITKRELVKLIVGNY